MIRKIYNLIPRVIQERLKLIYYNLKIRQYNFGFKNGKYLTESKEGWKIVTESPLYFITRDIDRYEKFYKVERGDVVIDAGANEGLLTLVYASKISSDGKVYSFEPDRRNLMQLEKNLSLNELGNIEIIKKGLWSENSTVSFYEAGTVGSSIFYESENSEETNIHVLTLDHFVAERDIQQLKFIKMDIEGAEIEALAGSVKTLRKLNPNYAIASYHLINGEPTYKKVEDFFRFNHYPFKTVFFDDFEIITYAGPALEKLSDEI